MKLIVCLVLFAAIAMSIFMYNNIHKSVRLTDGEHRFSVCLCALLWTIFYYLITP